MAKLCLGTVQLGMKYGINNKYGQPSLEDCFDMFNIALDSGIDKFDTAKAYGDAEEILGKYITKTSNGSRMKIISKLKPNILDTEKGTPQQIVRNQVLTSLKKIHIDNLDGYLLHTPEYIYNSDVVDGLCKVKQEGLVEHIGVSIYDIKEGLAAIETGVVDYIQLPYSVFDQRGMVTGFLEKAKSRNITIFTRSAFLQGLILMNEEEVPEHLKAAREYVTIYNEIKDKHNINPVDGLLHFVSNNKYIDYLVFGVDKKEQLVYDIESIKNKAITAKFIEDIEHSLQNIGESIILPSLWKK